MTDPWTESLIASLVFTVLFGAWFLYRNWRAAPEQRQSWLGLAASALLAGAIFYGLTTATNLIKAGQIDASWDWALKGVKLLALALILLGAAKIVLARVRKP